MKQYLLLSFFIFTIFFSSYSQNREIPKELPEILIQQTEQIETLQEIVNQQAVRITTLEIHDESQQSKISNLSRKIQELTVENKNLNKKTDAIEKTTAENEESIDNLQVWLEDEIEETKTATQKTEANLITYKGRNNIGWIIASLSVLLLGVLIYIFLKKRIDRSKVNVEEQIKETRNTLEEESVKLDNKLVDILESQIRLSEEQKRVNKETDKQETDHSLALKVADEIVRIQRNISLMDPKTRGLKQLSRSAQRIQDNFVTKGYEIIDMVGQNYHEGMRVSANFIPSNEIESGKQIITRIIKPQVNYNGKMIQAAQIEVSIGE